MFVANTFAAWLIGLLADAGRKRLTTVVLGSEQERALRSAAAKAVQLTAYELWPDDDERADELAMVISQVFGDPAPGAPLAGNATVLESLQAGIAGQIAVLDDASLTGTGQSPAALLAVPGTVMAASLTGHLLREIMIRGSQPGSLTPLAAQLNHDLTHLQGQRIEGMLTQVLDRLARPGDTGGPVGWPLEQVRDPFVLEVHRPVEPDIPQPALPALPVYVSREHDDALAAVVTAAAAGTSGIAVLVGGSSTGKTRSCWEVLSQLHSTPGWRLWHPVDPQEALRGLPGAGPGTVVWLNEAQRYLHTADSTGERVAAGVRELLRDRDRGPVLVLATLWPQFWDELTTRPASGADPHAQARELLTGHWIPVPAAFTDEQLRELKGAEDPRLAQAAAGSRDGQVIQYLAGAPDLLDRYHNAPPAARALIDAAMDAARLGMPPALSRVFLEEAAPGYLTDTDWNLLSDDWIDQALGYTAKCSKGVRGPLAPTRPRPAPGDPDSPGGGPAWQLADYLDQHGLRARHELIPPDAFWAAAAADDIGPAQLTALARAAEDRGLLRNAARLYRQAHLHGLSGAGARLVSMLYSMHPGDPGPAGWVVAHASLDNPAGLADLLYVLRKAGAGSQVKMLLDRDPAAHASLDNPAAVAYLLRALRKAGAGDQVTTLANRAAAHASLDNPAAVAYLLRALRKVGAGRQVAVLLDRGPAAHAALGSPGDVVVLLRALRKAGAADQVTTLASRAAAHASLDNPMAIAHLLYVLRKVGGRDQVTTLASRAAAHASLDNPSAVASLLLALRDVGGTGQVTALLNRDPAAHARLDDPADVGYLLGALRRVEGTGQVTALLNRDPAAHVRLDNAYSVVLLLYYLRSVGASDQVTTLASRAATHVSLDHPRELIILQRTLQEAAETSDYATTLASRAADCATFNEPAYVADQLADLREAGIASLVPLDHSLGARVRLSDPDSVACVLDELLMAGANEQAAELTERLPAAGMFQLFLEHEDHRNRFRFGREADGRPAKRWAWTDISNGDYS